MDAKSVTFVESLPPITGKKANGFLLNVAPLLDGRRGTWAQIGAKGGGNANTMNKRYTDYEFVNRKGALYARRRPAA